MNRARRNSVISQCSTITLVTTIVCILTWKCTYQCTSIKSVVCEIDAQLSATMQDELRQYCVENMTMNAYSHDQVIQKIKQHYPCVRQCVCRYTMPQCIHVTIKAHRPHICLNKTTIMTKTGNLLRTLLRHTKMYLI
jgi:hypothetical protein